MAVSGRLVVLASGSGSNLQAIIDACESGRLDASVVKVIVNRRTATSRERARAHGIDEEFWPLGPYRDRIDDPRVAREAYDTDLADCVDAVSPDLVVQAGWMHLFTSAFLDRFSGRVVNLHPALPGTFPGADAIGDAWAAHEDAGLDRTGVMVHLVPDEGVDDGPVLACREVPILADDTRETLEERIHAVEHELLVGAIGDLLVGP